MPDDNPTPERLRELGFTEEEIGKIANRMRAPVRETLHLEPVSDPLIAFFWARLDEAERRAPSEHFVGGESQVDRCPAARDPEACGDLEYGEENCDCGLAARRAEVLADVAAKKEILDDYARRCADLDNPARELECQLIRDVIKRLATVYAGHPDYDPAWRP